MPFSRGSRDTSCTSRNMQLAGFQKKKKLRRLVRTFTGLCPRSVSLAYMSSFTSSAVPVVGIRKAGASRLTKTAASARVNEIEWKQFLSFATRVWQVHFIAGEYNDNENKRGLYTHRPSNHTVCDWTVSPSYKQQHKFQEDLQM